MLANPKTTASHVLYKMLRLVARHRVRLLATLVAHRWQCVLRLAILLTISTLAEISASSSNNAQLSVTALRRGSLLYFQCRSNDDKDQVGKKALQSSSELHEECCQELKNEISNMTGKHFKQEDLHALCSRHLTRLPQVELPRSKIPEENPGALEPSSSSSTPSLFVTPFSSGEINREGVSFMLVYDFDEEVSTSSAQSWEVRRNEGSLFAPKTSSFYTLERLESHLSEHGGMHRTLFTSFQLLAEYASTSEPTQYDISLYFLFYLPPDWFINVEDAFEDSKGGPAGGSHIKHISLVTVEGTIINEEEPSFASSAHAVIIKVDISVSSRGRPSPIGLSFRTKVHLRYPKPQSVKAYHPVWLLSPIFVAGNVQTMTESGMLKSLSVIPNERESLSQPSLSATEFKYVLPQVLVTSVATGWEQDTWVVVLISLLVSIFGATVMLRDLARITRWS